VEEKRNSVEKAEELGAEDLEVMGEVIVEVAVVLVIQTTVLRKIKTEMLIKEVKTFPVNVLPVNVNMNANPVTLLKTLIMFL